MRLEYFGLALKNLKKRGIRTWLTMLGIFIGIAAIVSLVSLGQGLEEALITQFEELGADKISIVPGSIFAAPGSTSIEFTTADLSVVEKTKGVELAAPALFKVDAIESRDEKVFTFMWAMEPDDLVDVYAGLSNFKIDRGRYLKKSDTFKAVLGMRYGRDDDLFEKAIEVGDKVTVIGHEFDVVGILQTIGNPQDDSTVIITLDIGRELWDEPERVDYIVAQAKEGEDPEKVAERIRKNLRDHRDVEEGSEDFEAVSFTQLLESFGTILTVVQAVLIGISAISLLVGGIGITNTMYTSVLERTSEIGVMKAIGAKNSDILSIFLIEAGVLGTVGGSIGILLGMGFSKLVSLFAIAATGTTIFQTHFPPSLIIFSLVFSFVVGSVSGLVPAIQASRMKPVDALRYE